MGIRRTLTLTQKIFYALIESFAPEWKNEDPEEPLYTRVITALKEFRGGALGLKIALLVLNLILPAVALTFRPFHLLSPEKRIRVLSRLENHRFAFGRLLFILAKLIAVGTLYSSPQSRGITKYTPGCAS